jgi:hypothetical protein
MTTYRGSVELELIERPVIVPERYGKALLPWMARPDVRPAFYASAVTGPRDVDDFVRLWEDQQGHKPDTLVGGAISAGALPDTLGERVNAVLETEQFRAHYQPFGAQFATVTLDQMITPQWWVDSGYVDELAANVPAVGDDEGLFDFCFASGQLAAPVLLGTNGVAFASPRRDLGNMTPLRMTSYSPERVTFQFHVTPRPNWVWIATIQGLERFYIMNGVHHLLALHKAGRDKAFCLIRAVGSVDQVGMNFQDPALFNPSELLSARPPVLQDYLDPDLASDVSVRSLDQFMRFAINNEIGVVPRGE